MQLSLAVLAGLSIGLCASGPALAAREKHGRLHEMLIPGLPNAQCAGPGSGQTPKCKDVTFDIAAVQIPNPAGGDPLCLAYFTYNSLKVMTGRGNGGADLSWNPPANARFFGYGIAFTTPPGVPLDKIVKSQGPGTVKIKAKALLKTEFGHLPDIELNINGKWTHCGGADPGIVVTAD